ncbi:hypothetical protein [uncultured Shewanella sp.]|uniref:hypothetical protein n=1 Tax=uncultured Shewanella sp. TaxID=173975 RepID=UPI002624BF72|nr:hypothetical protein [uncultured Shewanella sp.]
MKTTRLSDEPDTRSPAGAEVRFMMEGATGGMIHCSLLPFQINKAVMLQSMSFGMCCGHGEIWRDNGIDSFVTTLTKGASIDIQPNAVFQYRNVLSEPLIFICMRMPSWPDNSEAIYVDKGKWVSTV